MEILPNYIVIIIKLLVSKIFQVVLYCDNNKITSFNDLPSSVTHLYCNSNFITSFKYLPSSVTQLYCNNNQITSFQYLVNSINILYCNNNKIDSFQYLVNSVVELNCGNNQIISFEHLVNSVKRLYCDNNQITSVTELYCINNQITSFQHLPNNINQINIITDLLYIPIIFRCDFNITPDEIYKNRVIHGLNKNKINKIFKNKQGTKIQKIWQNYWYNDLIDMEGTQMCKFGYYC